MRVEPLNLGFHMRYLYLTFEEALVLGFRTRGSVSPFWSGKSRLVTWSSRPHLQE